MTCCCMNVRCRIAGQCLGPPGGQMEIAWMQSQAKSGFYTIPTAAAEPFHAQMPGEVVDDLKRGIQITRDAK